MTHEHMTFNDAQEQTPLDVLTAYLEAHDINSYYLHAALRNILMEDESRAGDDATMIALQQILTEAMDGGVSVEMIANMIDDKGYTEGAPQRLMTLINEKAFTPEFRETLRELITNHRQGMVKVFDGDRREPFIRLRFDPRGRYDVMLSALSDLLHESIKNSDPKNLRIAFEPEYDH